MNVYDNLLNLHDDLIRFAPRMLYDCQDGEDRVRRHGIEIKWERRNQENDDRTLVVTIGKPFATEPEHFIKERAVYFVGDGGLFGDTVRHRPGPWDEVVELIYQELLTAIDKGKAEAKRQEDEKKAIEQKFINDWTEFKDALLKQKGLLG